MQNASQRHPASYRDPSGFMFQENGTWYRQVNQSYKGDFEKLKSSGLLKKLWKQDLILKFTETQEEKFTSENFYTTLQPEQLNFLSNPCEWPFAMLKEAALLTLKILSLSLEHGMILKDATAFNIQWHEGRMLHIDSLSFTDYNPKQPWIAYRQFCEHFYAPLALMHFLKEPLQPFMKAMPEGISIPTAAKLLPFKSKLHLHSYLNIHLHAKAAGMKDKKTNKEFSLPQLQKLIRSLREGIESFHFDDRTGVWSGYYEEALTREHYIGSKTRIISEWLKLLPLNSAIDLGANEGHFSKLLSQKFETVVSTDFDHYAVNSLFKEKNKNILPLVLDISQPTPATGFPGAEFPSFVDRMHFDLVMSLALIHHITIGKNIPFNILAELMQNMGDHLIMEFVPRSDPKVQFMVEQKEDIYHWYTEENFIATFSQYFSIEDIQPIQSSDRKLFLMKNRKA